MSDDIVTRLRATERAIWDGDDAEERRAFIKMVADEIDRWRNLAIHAWCHMGVDATCSSDDCEECQAIEAAWDAK
jgi:hypothetical protein